MPIVTEKLELKLDKPKFDRSRLRVYYGNIGEVIAQEVLRGQGFEAWLPRPVAGGRDHLRILHLKEMNEELEKLRRYYDRLPLFRKEEESLEEYIKRHGERMKRTIEVVGAFFGDQLNAFKEYLKRLESESVGYSCDLIAKRDHKIYVIEVKSTKRAARFLRGEKLRGLTLAKEYGFIPAVVTLNLKIEATSFKMEEI